MYLRRLLEDWYACSYYWLNNTSYNYGNQNIKVVTETVVIEAFENVDVIIE